MDKEKVIKEILKINKKFERNTRLSRFLQDPIRTTFYYMLQVIVRIYPIWVKHNTLWGVPMQYYLPEGNQIYYYGFYEANLSNFLIRFLKGGDVLLDVGANIGFYSMLGSSLVGNGKVFAFEPTPRTYTTLKKNADTRKNIQPINMALSDTENDQMIIDYGMRLSAFNTMHPRKIGEIGKILKKGKGISVTSTTIDNFIAQNNLYNITFIKIDAEGHESKILSGSQSLLKNQRPIISIEVGQDFEWKENVKNALEILKNNKYSSYEASVDGYLKRREFDKKTSTNLIFVPNEKIDIIRSLIII